MTGQNKKNEHTAGETAAWYKYLVDNARDLIQFVDSEGKFVFVNQTWLSTLGYTAAEIKNIALWDIIHPDSMEHCMAVFKQVLTGKAFGEVEAIFVTKDGTPVMVEGNVGVKLDKSGRFLHTRGIFRNITKRRELEEALRESEKRYRFLSENMGDVAWTMDMDLNTTYISPSATKVFGFTPEERLQQKIDQIMPPQSLALIMQRFQEEMAKEQHDKIEQDRQIIVEAEFYHKNGGTVWMENLVKAIRDKDGKPIGIYGSSRDITERKKTQDELLALKNFNERIVQNIKEGIIISNKDGVATFANRALLNMLGYTADEFIGSHWNLVVPTEQHCIVADADRRRNIGLIDRYELTLKHKSGTLIPVQVSGSPNYDQKTGEIMGTLAVLTDLSDFKKAQELIIANEERLRLMTRNIQDVVLETDANGYYTYVSESSESVIGYKSMELLGRRAFDFIHPADAEKVALTIIATVESRKVVRMEYRYKHRTRGYIWVEGVGRTYQNSNNETMVLITVRDITDRRKYESDLKYMSFHDQLTGLYNRHFLETEMERLDTDRQLPISIIMADLNGLKLINDTYGHSIGDEMLKKAALVLKEACREEDIIARFGGDEFVLYLPRTPENEALKICSRIEQACRQEQSSNVPLSLSTGVAIKVSAEQKLYNLLKEAEDNLYQNKLTESRSGRSAIVKTLLETLAAKSCESETHTRNMQETANRIGVKLGLTDAELRRLHLLITLHDIGKINIHEELLTKEGSLTAEEWEIMKKHCETGYRIARAAEEFAHVADDILAHHEHWDGSGYPQRLKGKEAPLLARIAAIADAYEVMSHGRPYKKAMSRSDIIAEFNKCSGTQFDLELVEVFLSTLEGDG
jgi:diguanylate cyclase (GGDEF)-like protein/PAS domain S-box-containing protein